MKLYRIAAPLLLFALPLAACGGGGDDDDDTTADSNDLSAELTVLPGGGNSSGDNSAISAKIAALDLCPMLTDAEATEVSNKAGLGGNGVVATYTIKREKGVYTAEQLKIRAKSSCRFVIESNGGGSGVIQVEVTEADDYESLFKPGGKAIPNLGDDAVNNKGTVYVRVGDLMMTTGEDSFTTDYATEILRKMAPDLK